MEYRKLGESGPLVSTVGMGCWAIAGDSTWGTQDEQDAVAAIRAALDVGITLFDTAEGYGGGESERLLAKGLGTDRAKAIIATKVSGGHLEPDQVREACERSLKYLETDYIDLYQVHWPSDSVPFAETFAALNTLQQEGKIRYIGVSNFGVAGMTEMTGLGVSCVSNQLAYSLLARAIEFEIQPYCDSHGIGILPYSPLAQGLLTGKFASADEVPAGRARTRHFSSTRPGTRHGEAGCETETFAAIAVLREVAAELGQSMGTVALAWLLHRPAVTSVLAGARDAAQAKTNATAADLKLTPEILARLDAATEPVKQALGANPDLWVGGGTGRVR